MTGIDVRYTTRNQETFDGYLTGPDGNAKAPGILLITAIFGVDQEMRELADAWARDGFLVSVPDIFWRQLPGPTADMSVAFDRYGKFDPVQGMKDIEDLVRDLKARPQCNGRRSPAGPTPTSASTPGPATTSRCRARTATTPLRRGSRATGCFAASGRCSSENGDADGARDSVPPVALGRLRGRGRGRAAGRGSPVPA